MPVLDQCRRPAAYLEPIVRTLAEGVIERLGSIGRLAPARPDDDTHIGDAYGEPTDAMWRRSNCVPNLRVCCSTPCTSGRRWLALSTTSSGSLWPRRPGHLHSHRRNASLVRLPAVTAPAQSSTVSGVAGSRWRRRHRPPGSTTHQPPDSSPGSPTGRGRNQKERSARNPAEKLLDREDARVGEDAERSRRAAAASTGCRRWFRTRRRR